MPVNLHTAALRQPPEDPRESLGLDGEARGDHVLRRRQMQFRRFQHTAGDLLK